MYKIIVVMSIIIRQFYLPNPFESFGVWAPLYNLALTGVIGSFTFAIVGIYYTRGSNPSLGSFLYLLFFIIHTAFIMLMGVFDFAKWWVVLVSILYIAMHIGISKVRNLMCGGAY